MDYVPTSLLLPGSFFLTALLTLTPAEPRPLEFRVVPEPATARIAAPSFLLDPCTGCAAQPVSGVPANPINVVTDPSWGNGQCTGTMPDCTPNPYPLDGEVMIQNVYGSTLFVTWKLGDEEGSQEILNTEHFFKTLEGKSVPCGGEFRITFKNQQQQVVASYVLACSPCPTPS